MTKKGLDLSCIISSMKIKNFGIVEK